MSDAPVRTLDVTHVEAAPTPPNPDNKMVPCPECGREYRGPAGLGRHRATQHGVRGKSRSAREYHARKAKKNGNRAQALEKFLAEHPEPEEPDLTIDDLFDVVIGELFPSGSIPVAAMPALMRWRTATEQMLGEVSGAS